MIALPLCLSLLATADAGTSSYSGHGAASVSPEVLAQFAPPPLPAEVSHRIQAMLDLRAPGSGIPSPDGKRLFFGWGVSGSPQVWRLDGPQHFPLQLTGGEDTTLVLDVAPNGSFVIVSRDRNGEENPGLYWVSPDGGPLHVIQHKPGIQTQFDFVSDDGKWVYFHSNDVKQTSYVVYRWNKDSRAREVVFDQDGLWSVADHRAGKLLLAKEVGSNMVEYSEWDEAAHQLTPLFGQGEREDYEAAYGATPGDVLVRTPKLGEYRRLYRWHAGKLDPVTPELKWDVSGFHVDQARAHVLYEVNEGGYTRLHALDAKTFKEVTLPQLPSADHVGAGVSTRDGRFQVLRVDMGTQPLLSYVLDWRTGKLTQWVLPSAPEMDLSTFARATLESYPARDGTPIPMFVWRPATCAEPCPVIVMFHGGPEMQTAAGFNVLAQLFVDEGFTVAMPNVRGSDGYGKTWIHADDGPKRLNVITDIEDASTFVRTHWAKNGQAPKVGIFGGSYGGYASLVGMTKFAGAYDAGVAIVGMSNLVTFLKNTAPYRRILRMSEYGDPDKDHDALVQLSPITFVDRVKAPLLIIQGASDPRVPVGEAVQFHDSLEARHIPHRVMIFADEGHGARKRGNLALEYGHAVDWFVQNLKGAAKATP